VTRQTHYSRGHPRFGRSTSNHPRSPSGAASISRSIDCHGPRGIHYQRVNNIDCDRWPTTRVGLNCGSPGGGAPLGFTTSAKMFTSWPAPFSEASALSSIPQMFFRTLEPKNDWIRRERSPFVVCHDHVLKIANNMANVRSRTQFYRVPCSVPATRKSESLLRTKSERQVRVFGSNAYGV